MTVNAGNLPMFPRWGNSSYGGTLESLLCSWKGSESVWNMRGQVACVSKADENTFLNVSNLSSILGAGALAFAARSGVNLFVLFFNLARTPKYVLG